MRQLLVGLRLASAACVLLACGSDDTAVPSGGPADGGSADVDANDGDARSPDASDASACAAPRTTCGGACTDLTTDVANCGACGHACGCGSTRCTNGVCDPAVLADKQGGPFTLTQSAGYLYWGNDADQTLSRVSVAGGEATVIYPGRTAVRGIAANATALFFTRNAFNIIESGALDGSGGGGNYTNTREPGSFGIAVDATNVYWANSAEGGAIRTTTFAAPRSPSNLITGQPHAANVVVDADYIYWTTNEATTGTVMRMSKTGGTAVAIAKNQLSPFGLAVDANFVYWTNQGDGATSNGSVNEAPIGSTGDAVTPIATGQKYPFYIAVDESFVYWTDLQAGTVEKAPIAGGPSTPIAVNQDQPLGLALDASCVYFTAWGAGASGAGSILKTGK